MAISQQPDVAVYTKSAWSSTWTRRATLEPVKTTEAVAPQISAGLFRQYYGSKNRDGERKSYESALNLAGHYVLVYSNIGHWMGIIQERTLKIIGYDASDREVGTAFFNAVGLEFALNTETVYSSKCLVNETVTQVDRCHSFNVRNKRGGTEFGNRSVEKHDGTYVFAAGDDGGATWTHRDILEYALPFLMPPNIPFEFGGVFSDLDHLAGAYNLEGHSMMRILNRLVDRRRGYGWCVRTTVDDPTDAGRDEDTATIHIFSMLDTDISVTRPDYSQAIEEEALDTKLFQANTDTDWIDDGDYPSCEIQIMDRAPVYHTVRVKGARVKSLFTVLYAGSDDLVAQNKALVDAWPDLQELDYYNGQMGADAYDALPTATKQLVNDDYRAGDELVRVFTEYKLSDVWNFHVPTAANPANTLTMNPKIDANGLTENDQANIWRHDQVLLPALPLLENRDYTAEGWPANDDALDAKWRKPFAMLWYKSVAEDATPSRYRLAHDLGDRALSDARVEPMEREAGLRIRFRPNHILGPTNWKTVAQPSSFAPQFTLEEQKLMATVAMELDEQLVIVRETALEPEDIPEYAGVLSISVPDAELWIAADTTVVGLDADGKAEQISTSGLDGYSRDYWGRIILRSDAWRLKVIADMAMAWHSLEHRPIHVRTQTLEALPRPGVLITNVFDTAVNSIVTARTWDWDASMSEIKTEYWDVDWSKLNIGGATRPGLPDVWTLAQTVVDTAKDVAETFGWGEK